MIAAILSPPHPVIWQSVLNARTGQMVRTSGTRYSALYKSKPLHWTANEHREFSILLKLIISVSKCWLTPLTSLQLTALFVMVQLHKIDSLVKAQSDRRGCWVHKNEFFSVLRVYWIACESFDISEYFEVLWPSQKTEDCCQTGFLTNLLETL